MPTLYDAGWRQGSILTADLPLDVVILSEDGHAARQLGEHPRWAVATQECDLDSALIDGDEPIVELRPIHMENPPQDWGIRSARFRITETEYVISTDPRQFVSPALLTALLAEGSQRVAPTASRSRAFAIWLGRRYDRPALPPSLVPLARRISEEVSRRPGRPVASNIRDVLMQFDESRYPTRFSLVAVLNDAAEEQAVREWLAGIATRVPDELGVADILEAATADRISFQLVEESYAADVSRLTWRPNDPDPVGA